MDATQFAFTFTSVPGTPYAPQLAPQFNSQIAPQFTSQLPLQFTPQFTPQLAPQGFFGSLLGGPVGGLIGNGIGGLFGNPTLGRQLGQTAGTIGGTFLPFNVDPMTAAYAQQVQQAQQAQQAQLAQQLQQALQAQQAQQALQAQQAQQGAARAAGLLRKSAGAGRSAAWQRGGFDLRQSDARRTAGRIGRTAGTLPAVQRGSDHGGLRAAGTTGFAGVRRQHAATVRAISARPVRAVFARSVRTVSAGPVRVALCNAGLCRRWHDRSVRPVSVALYDARFGSHAGNVALTG